MNISQEVNDALALPPVAWEEFCDGKLSASLEPIADKLSNLAVYAARMAKYLEWRMLGQDHGAAVKRSNQAVSGVRKALGFAYPDAEALSF